MAHFAELDENNVVLRVIVVHNNECLDSDGQESEAKGVDFCQSLFGGRWVQTSYNSSFRKNYAGEGYTYNANHDAFIPPQPYPSWVLNLDNYRWIAPKPYPYDGKNYFWDEEALGWVEFDTPI